MSKHTLAVIGAGASGLMSAIAAKRRCQELGKDVTVLLLEKNPRAGKKLLATGNGRCNLANTEELACAYHTTEQMDTVSVVLGAFPVHAILQFFAGIGLETVTHGSLVYPRSMQAASVLDVLRFEAQRLGVVTQCGSGVKAVRKTGGTFLLQLEDGGAVKASAVIVATGSAAGGGSDAGLALLKRLGHRIVPAFPALTPLKCDGTYIKTAAGMRAQARASLVVDGAVRRTETGEVLFTDYGLSGIAVMQLSGEASRLFALGKKQEILIALDLAPEYTFSDLYALLQQRREILADLPLEQLLCGFLNKRVALAVLKAAEIGGLSTALSAVPDKNLKTLASVLKNWRIPVLGVKGASSAQVMGGGAALREFAPKTLMSTKANGLFACGEALDVYGDCGGYNLTWAWASGFVSGRAAAEFIE